MSLAIEGLNADTNFSATLQSVISLFLLGEHDLCAVTAAVIRADMFADFVKGMKLLIVSTLGLHHGHRSH